LLYSLAYPFDNIWVFIDNKIQSTFSYKDNGKTLKWSKETKPFKVINKVLEFFKDNPAIFKTKEEYEELVDLKEQIRLWVSQVLNGHKKKQFKITLSIHPLDYLTMSDNDSDWNTCMSWGDRDGGALPYIRPLGGCYHLGTVEMMNSNNVLVAFVESDTSSFCFHPEPELVEGDERYTWNNKRWRQLFIINKDIIVGGKAYPYSRDNFTKHILRELRMLALKNLKWDYEFGIEPYKDMQEISWSSYAKMRKRQYYGEGHHIYFDTAAMYNDLLNDKKFKYYCIRNKVDKNLIISYSGKAPCAHCMNDVKVKKITGRYNDRYTNIRAPICPTCRKEHICDDCNDYVTHGRLYKLRVTKDYDEDYKEDINICGDCYISYIKECPICHQNIYYVDNFNDRILVYDSEKQYRRPICVCKKCNNKLKNDPSFFIKNEEGDFIGSEYINIKNLFIENLKTPKYQLDSKNKDRMVVKRTL
jgi:hypothetical protein